MHRACVHVASDALSWYAYQRGLVGRWCGHCKNLVPEWKKAAAALKGVATVAAVDATAHSSLAAQFGVQGYPTIKIFGADKSKPSDFNGQRTASGIVEAVMKEVGATVNRRMGRKASSSGSGSGSGSGSSNGGADSSKPGGGKEVVTLTADNFDSLVLNSDSPWMVEFYAPWCGHCKTLAPEWAEAAGQLKGEVKLGAVDATAHEALGARFSIKGFPTIKYFAPGSKSSSDAVDYEGPRDAAGIIAWARTKAEESGAAAAAAELTSQAVLEETCGGKRICVIAFLQSLYDTRKSGRQAKIAELESVARKERRSPFRFLWTYAGQHPALERAMGIEGAIPAVVALSPSKGTFAIHRGAQDEEGLLTFTRGLLSGRVKPAKFADGAVPKASTVTPWDGQDYQEEEDDFDPSSIIGDGEL